MDEYTLIKCPDCNGGGKKIEIMCSFSLFGGYREFENRTKEDCPRCGGLGTLKVKLDKIKQT